MVLLYSVDYGESMGVYRFYRKDGDEERCGRELGMGLPITKGKGGVLYVM